MTERRIMLIEIVETVEEIPSTFAHTCHPDGVRSTTIELPPEVVEKIHAEMSKVYEKHRIQCQEAMKRSWKRILEGMGKAQYTKNQFLLHDAEYQAREQAKKTARNNKSDK